MCSKGSLVELIENKFNPSYKSTHYLCVMHFNIILPSTPVSLKCSLPISMSKVLPTATTDKLDTPHYIAWNWFAAKYEVCHKWWAFGRELNSKSARKDEASNRNKESAKWWHETSLMLPTKTPNKYRVKITLLFSYLHFNFAVAYRFLCEKPEFIISEEFFVKRLSSVPWLNKRFSRGGNWKSAGISVHLNTNCYF